MNKKTFLKKSDEGILDYFVSESVYSNGKHSIDAFLTIGKPDIEIAEKFKEIPEEQIENPTIIGLIFEQREICLTKKDLKFLISEIEKAEKDPESMICDDDEYDELT